MPSPKPWVSPGAPGTHLVRIEDSEKLGDRQATPSWNCVSTGGLQLQLQALNTADGGGTVRWLAGSCDAFRPGGPEASPYHPGLIHHHIHFKAFPPEVPTQATSAV